MNPVKVLHLRSGTRLFGPERVILSLGRCAAPDFQIIVGGMGRGKPGLLLEEAAALGLETFWLECRRRLDFAAIRRLAEFLRARDIRLLHAHDFKANFYALAARRYQPMLMVATLHLWNRSSAVTSAYEIFDALQVRFFDQVIAVSPEIAEQARRWRIPAEKVRVILNGVDMARFKACSQCFRNERIVIGSVGRLTRQKGYHDFLRAAAKVSQACPRARFLLVGDGPQRGALEAEAEQLGISHLVTFAGQRDPVEASYAEMDLFVSSSLSEGLPVAVLEAMASSLPVVATAVGASGEVIENEKSGLLVPPANVDALASALLRLVNTPDEAMTLAAAGRERVARHFSAEKMTRETESVYGELLHGKED